MRINAPGATAAKTDALPDPIPDKIDVRPAPQQRRVATRQAFHAEDLSSSHRVHDTAAVEHYLPVLAAAAGALPAGAGALPAGAGAVPAGAGAVPEGAGTVSSVGG